MSIINNGAENCCRTKPIHARPHNDDQMKG
jgi:hypothetical protein